MRWHIFFYSLALCFTAPTCAQDFSWPHGNQGTSGGGGTYGQDEESYETDGSLPKESRNPNADERKRLVVEWGKIAMGSVDRNNSVTKGDQYWQTWKYDDSLHQDRMLSIRGKLLIESADGKSRVPIDWVQGVRVIVSRLPEKKYDWSNRQEMHHATWGDFVIWEKGEFLAMIQPGDVRRAVGKELSFQVALSLAEKTEKKITWKNTVPVLPQSVAMLKIPGPPAISQTMQMINAAPSYSQNDFNPAKLVRAVNHLMPMGKEKAIRELREFLKIARDSSETMRVEENIDTSDKTCVFLIVRLLFECSDRKGKLPDIMTIPFTPIPKNSEKKLWPFHPVHLQDDVPFFLVNGGAMGGAPDQPERHVDWAEKNGRIRNRPIRPLDNPMTAAQRLISLPQTKRLFQREDFKELFCRQAWNIIQDADPETTKPQLLRPVNSWESVDWDARMATASKLKIHWSETEQKYIMK